jgi:hypothetical protein
MGMKISGKNKKYIKRNNYKNGNKKKNGIDRMNKGVKKKNYYNYKRTFKKDINGGNKNNK